MDDGSQAFYITAESIDDVYLNVLAIYRTRQLGSKSNDDMEFTVLIAGYKQFYRAQFAVTNADGQIQLKKAVFYKSATIDYNAGLVKAYHLPHHQSIPQIAGWENFYFMMTTTREFTQEEIEIEGKELRVKDGMMFSEYALKKIDLALI